MSSSSSSKLSRERLSDDLPERSLSHGSRRASSKILAKNGEPSGKKFASKKKPLANACFFWLLMLYYKHSRQNGQWSPLGIDTSLSFPFAGLPAAGQNGQWSPLGIDTCISRHAESRIAHGKMASGARWGLIPDLCNFLLSILTAAKWPVEPVGDWKLQYTH